VNHGTALSFVAIKEMDRLQEVEEALADTHAEGETLFQPYNFRMEEIEGFRYRAKDAMRSVTKVAVREARLKEIKSEILNSQKLKSYFEDNPRDLQLLRHDKDLHTVKVQAHLQNVPDYLVPPTLRSSRRGPRRPKGGAQGGKPFNKKQARGERRYQKRRPTL